MRNIGSSVLAITASVLVLAIGGSASAFTAMINDGMTHVIDDDIYDSDSIDVVAVRNVDCPPGWPGVLWDDDCPSPGDPTQAALVPGAVIRGEVHVFDSSTIEMSDGFLGRDLRANDSSTITVSGGQIDEDLVAQESSRIVMSGGSVWGDVKADASSVVIINGGAVGNGARSSDTATLRMTGGTVLSSISATSSGTFIWSGGWLFGSLEARNSSTIIIVGYDFEVNGSPVPYGELAEPFGRLTGTLASGEPIDNIFYQGAPAGEYTGTITLASELSAIPVPALQPSGLIGLGSLLLAFGLVALAAGRRRR